MAIKPPISTISFYDEYTREQFVDEVVNNGGSLVIPGPVYVVHNIYDQSTCTVIFTSEQQAFSYVMSIVLGGSSFDNLNNSLDNRGLSGSWSTRYDGDIVINTTFNGFLLNFIIGDTTIV